MLVGKSVEPLEVRRRDIRREPVEKGYFGKECGKY